MGERRGERGRKFVTARWACQKSVASSTLPVAVYVGDGTARALHICANGLRIPVHTGHAERCRLCPHRSRCCGCHKLPAVGFPLLAPRKGVTPRRMQEHAVTAPSSRHVEDTPRERTRIGGKAVVRGKFKSNGGVGGGVGGGAGMACPPPVLGKNVRHKASACATEAGDRTLEIGAEVATRERLGTRSR